jgi:hypothetical protein
MGFEFPSSWLGELLTFAYMDLFFQCSLDGERAMVRAPIVQLLRTHVSWLLASSLQCLLVNGHGHPRRFEQDLIEDIDQEEQSHSCFSALVKHG